MRSAAGFTVNSSIQNSLSQEKRMQPTTMHGDTTLSERRASIWCWTVSAMTSANATWTLSGQLTSTLIA
ncbi:unnamed protein product [Staurois parvus]|uniref:Uncharacterized protein n=1 Tax=Staurois parvus TaxID=386267 RepID=A0ABN9B0Y0_9NEOB|nr:unnamed protein product [Staurois parvus]